MTDTHQRVWKDVNREKVQEINRVHLCPAVLSAIPVILPVVLQCTINAVMKNTGIGDCNTVGIASDVIYNLVHTLCRRTAIYNPRLAHAFLSYGLRDWLFLRLEFRGQHG